MPSEKRKFAGLKSRYCYNCGIDISTNDYDTHFCSEGCKDAKK